MKFIIDLNKEEILREIESGSLKKVVSDMEGVTVRIEGERTKGQLANEAPAQATPTAEAPTAKEPAPTVPTSAKTYTLDEMAKAAVSLMDAGKQDQLLKVLNEDFHVQSMPELTRDQYPAFTIKLREMGADI